MSEPQPAVLIVDDDPGIRSSLSRILKVDGYRVDTAASAKEAIERDHWIEYFAILLDWKLPDRTATDLLPQLVVKAPEASVVVITGYADLETSMAAIRAGASDYLLKPVDPDDLRVRLRRLADLKQVRDQVRIRDEQMRFMIEHLPAGAAYIDDQSGHLRVNQAVERITGFSADELTTRDDWFNVIDGKNSNQHRVYFEANRQSGFSQPRRIKLQRKSGELMDVEFSGYKNDKHEVWLLNDITERAQFEEKLREQRDFSDQILETAQVIVLVLDPAAKIVRFNKFMQDLSGYRLSEVAGQNWFDIFVPAAETSETRKVFNRVATGQAVQGHINRMTLKNGTDRQIAWWAKALKGPQDQVTAILSIGHDVTAFRDIQGKLVQSERLAAIGEMIAGLAHESRNALQRARACLDMLTLDLVDNPGQTDLTQRIQKALDELQRLYEEVRGYAAPVQLSLGRHDLKEIWRTSWQNVLETHSERTIQLNQTCAEIDTVCQVDQLRIEQVFRNILENAVAASPAPSLITLRASKGFIKDEPAISVSISDQGEGLKTDDPEQIFEPFYTTKQKGTGLGMAISRRIVEAHHGTIRVTESSPAGVTIEICLPLQQ